MNSLLGKLQNKLHEARISDVNHELGKVKESLFSESTAYLRNFRSDARNVRSLIRSESQKFSQQLFGGASGGDGVQGDGEGQDDDDRVQEGGGAGLLSHLTKSPSLPAFASSSSGLSGTAADPKYQYKSSLAQAREEEEDEDLGLDEKVADKFIRVVEVDPTQTLAETPSPQARAPPRTREEIRRKLAVDLFGGGAGGVSSDQDGDDPAGAEGGPAASGQKAGNSDLQICFINEAVDDDNDDEDEEEDVVSREQSKEDSSEDVNEYDEEEDEDEDASPESVFPRSRSEWEAFRNPDLLTSPSSSRPAGSPLPPPPDAGRTPAEERRLRRYKKKLSRLQKELQLNLRDCQQIARRHIEKERRRRQADHPLKRLLSLADDEDAGHLGEERLRRLNLASLQVVVNHCHSEVERLNEELVSLLLDKDELQIEQDSQLLDVEDLSHAVRIC